MICTLLEAIEMNEEFTRSLVEAEIESQFVMLKLTGAMEGYHLGVISGKDPKNMMVYAEMSNTITKIFHQIERMFPGKK